MIALIAAIAKNNVIGSKDGLPWYLPEDLKRFKQITLGKTVLMGRKTYESIIKRLGKPLPNRTNVVITRRENFSAPPEVKIFHSIYEALSALGQHPSLGDGEGRERSKEDIYVIGGAQIFNQTLPLAEKLIITHIHKAYPGDVYFPEIDFSKWQKTFEEPHADYTFAEYERKTKQT